MSSPQYSSDESFVICGNIYSAEEVRNSLLKISNAKSNRDKRLVSGQSVLIRIPINVFASLWMERSRNPFNLDAIILEIFLVGGHDTFSSLITPDEIKRSFSIDGNNFNATEFSFVINETSTSFLFEHITFNNTSGFGALFCFFAAKELVAQNAFLSCVSYGKYREIFDTMIYSLNRNEIETLESMLMIDQEKWWLED